MLNNVASRSVSAARADARVDFVAPGSGVQSGACAAGTCSSAAASAIFFIVVRALQNARREGSQPGGLRGYDDTHASPCSPCWRLMELQTWLGNMTER